MSQLSFLGEPAAAPRQVSLTKLAVELGRTAAQLGLIVVEGEIHGRVNAYDNGRKYFVLKDRTAQMSVYVSASRSRHCRTVSGERVAVTATLVWIPERGQMQLEAREIVPVGEGAVALMVAETRERLRADGLLDRERLLLPLLPASIGVVCGNDAAVKKDIEAIAALRFPGFPVRFVEVTVSGSGAAESILNGLVALLRDSTVHVVILARGGGDAAQLLPFSDETLCRAIAASPVPVISAIGHEADRPLSDEVADARAGTPSIAAGMAVPHLRDLVAKLDAGLERAAAVAAQRLVRSTNELASLRWTDALDRRLERGSDRLARITWRDAPHRSLERARTRVQVINWAAPIGRRQAWSEARLHSIVWDRTFDAQHSAAQARLGSAVDRVQALSPARVLARGYAVMRDDRGMVVRDPSTLAAGDEIEVTVAGGTVSAVVREARPL
jgi:exodeoxyribonuclease VII large subunit